MQVEKRLLDPHYEVGEITSIEASSWLMKIKHKGAAVPISGYGEPIFPITFGSYVAAMTEESSIVLAKVTELIAATPPNLFTIVKCQILSSYCLLSKRAERGIASRPLLGRTVFAIPPTIVPIFLGETSDKSIEIGSLMDSQQGVSVSLKDLFAKHCAIVGNTGSGKSWSVASIIEKASKKVKFILIDATGEFSSFDQRSTVHLDVGNNTSCGHSKLVNFNYRNLTVEDLFAFFRPSAQAQAPILREAIKTLKLIEAGKLRPNTANGCFQKTPTNRTAFEAAYAQWNAVATDSKCNFNLNLLTEQIKYECIDLSWNADNRGYGFQTTLLLRIEAWKSSESIKCLWDTQLPSLTDEVDSFLVSDKEVLRISLKNLSFEFSTREIVVNAFCRHLMRMARVGTFSSCPTVLAVDEAHNFFKPSFKLGDDEVANEALDIIAKEGRKYGLMLMLATQRPKDIPAGVMSQMGAIVCHRITNTADAEILRGTVGEFNRGVLSSLPTLTQGEAFLTTPSFTFPISIKVGRPTFEPDSNDPI